MTRSEQIEAILAATSGPNWAVLQEVLQFDINHLISQELQAEDMGAIREFRGFRKGLEYVMQLREVAKLEKQNATL